MPKSLFLVFFCSVLISSSALARTETVIGTGERCFERLAKADARDDAERRCMNMGGAFNAPWFANVSCQEIRINSEDSYGEARSCNGYTCNFAGECEL